MMDPKDVADPQSTSSQGVASGQSGGVKRRRRRNRVACDVCHARRVKCDLVFPCRRCLDSHVRCEFTRELRKRGRIPRAVSKAAASTSNNVAHAETRKEKSSEHAESLSRKISAASDSRRSPAVNGELPPSASPEEQPPVVHPETSPQNGEASGGSVADVWPSAQNVSYVPYSSGWLGGIGSPSGPFPDPVDMLGTTEIGGYPLLRGVSSFNMGQSVRQGSIESSLKYPVLQPLMPFVEHHLPANLICDLLELYFTSAFSTCMHPVCHHIHCYVLRKASFLTRDYPRPSSPALLASMLWVAALDDRAFGLSISPSRRRKICQFLCALTIRLLRPLIHVAFKGEGIPTFGNDHSSPSAIFEAPTTRAQSFEGAGGDDRGLVGPAGSLDDVITYMHVASIISASEQKAASMRWWHAAFTLARELKLNQELDADFKASSMESMNDPFYFGENGGIDAAQNLDYFQFTGQGRPSLNCVCTRTRGPLNPITEEYREERRRTWWLLYIMDRHLALCYNRPLALLDSECEDSLLPLDEGSWQAGIIHSNSPKADGPQCSIMGDKNKRRVFPDFRCNDPSLFGFFLPLMTITGELINLNQAKNHPILGLRLQGKEAWDIQVNEILRQLDVYKTSLAAFPSKNPDVEGAPGSNFQPDTVPQQTSPIEEAVPNRQPSAAQDFFSQSWHIQTVTAYASYLVHVLHILLVGKWDPVTLLEDKDFWTSSPAFASTISHALSAADFVEQILRFDPDVSFMPYFFGIQLLQGSFLLLLIVDRLQKEAGEGILKACEVVIRATESCVVTLNTEYQRNFRQVMRSAVAQARGRPVNHSDILHRRKAVLALYRWTRNGTGLAL
ncbi:transcriptional regulator family: Fungal Specific TF [Paecilomyces variotii]|nr:transcriptional regulator family: Fungal Specific TF [Paecilomyces variotii]